MATRRNRTTKPAQPSAPVIPTTASAWNGMGLYRLPSGNVAKLKRPGVLAAASISNGRNLISDAVLTRLHTDSAAPQTDEERAAVIRSNGASYAEIAKLCFVEPRIVDEPDYEAGEIAITDLEDDDLFWIFFDFVNGGAAHAATFRVG
jgi:hypothetical protein